jgi:hypothetical protein
MMAHNGVRSPHCEATSVVLQRHRSELLRTDSSKYHPLLITLGSNPHETDGHRTFSSGNKLACFDRHNALTDYDALPDNNVLSDHNVLRDHNGAQV